MVRTGAVALAVFTGAGAALAATGAADGPPNEKGTVVAPVLPEGALAAGGGVAAVRTGLAGGLAAG
ncbi:MAG: hypothetical protein ACXWLZ_07890, partial [Rhizomicrobium sp.]